MSLRSVSLTMLVAASCCPGVLISQTREAAANVPVIENRAPSWTPSQRWRLSAQPILDIGTDMGDPNYEFGFAHGPVRLKDGRIVVADMQANVMRFYDAKGKFLMSAGGSGQGPGEFEQLYRLRKISGDSLMALNPASLTSIFSPDGKYVRRFDLDLVRGRGNMWWLGRLANGTLVAMSLQREGTVERAGRPGDTAHPVTFDIPQKPPAYRDTLMHFLYDMQGRMLDSIVKLPGQWLGERTFAFVPNAAYAFHENTFFHSPGDVVEIRVFRATGNTSAVAQRSESPRQLVRLERIIKRAPVRSIVVNDSMKKEHEAELRARISTARANQAEMKQMIERQIANTKYPERIPAHHNRMYADALGNIWLQEYQINAKKPTQWSVFDPAGRWLGQVDMPVGFTVNEIGADYVLGVGLDDLDVQHVRMYRLEKPAR
jgi:hypothetical protein